MRTLTFITPHNLAQLNDELLSAIPALTPTVGPDGERRAVHRLEGRESDGWIRVCVPDDVSEAQVAAVVAAHRLDPHYGVPSRLTEPDLMALDDRALRRWLASRLL